MLKLKFSLKTFLILVACLAVGLGMWRGWRGARIQADIVSDLMTRGHYVEYQSSKQSNFLQRFAESLCGRNAVGVISGVYFDNPFDPESLKNRDKFIRRLDRVEYNHDDLLEFPRFPNELDRLTQLRSLESAELAVGDQYIGADLSRLSRLHLLRNLSIRGWTQNATTWGLQELSNVKQLRRLTLIGRLSDQGLLSVPELPQLEELTVCSTCLRGDGLAVNSRFPAIRKLVIRDLNLSEDALANLPSMQSLSELTLYVNRVDFSRLPDLPSLSRLRIDCAELRTSDLDRIARLDRLQLLAIRCKNIEPGGFKRNPKFREIKSLEINAPALSSEDIAAIAGTTQLRSLVLEGMSLDEVSLGEIAKLQDLESLSLFADYPFSSAIAIAAKLPKLRVLSLWSEKLQPTDCLRGLSAVANIERIAIASMYFKLISPDELILPASARYLDLSVSIDYRTEEAILVRNPNVKITISEGWPWSPIVVQEDIWPNWGEEEDYLF